MANLPITSNNPQAATANIAAGVPQKNDAQGAQPADPFGAVLARQIQADGGNVPAQDTSAVPGADAGITVDSAIQGDKAEQDALLVAGMNNDPSSAVAAMLQLPQEIRLPLGREAAATSALRGMADPATMPGRMAGVTMLREAHANKANGKPLPTNGGIMPNNAEPGLAAVAPGKANAAALVVGNGGVADKAVLRNEPVLEVAKNTVELPNKLADAAQSAQGVGQTASSMATSGMLPGVSVNDKNANSMQAVSSPLGSSGWADEFSQKITWMGTQQNQVAELHLNPPNLGPLDVVLKVSDNQATALFTSPHSVVRDAVENALPRLREILADSGITLGNAMVSDQSPRDRGADGSMDNGASARRETSGDAPRATGLSSATVQDVQVRRHNGMVDTFA